MKTRFLLNFIVIAIASAIVNAPVYGQADWVQIGSDIDGEFANDRAGSSVSINLNGSIVAVGSTENDGGGSNSGHVRVFQNILDVWTQVGGDINGEAANDAFGSVVSISDDGMTVAIGAPRNDGAGLDAGHVEVYELIGGIWTQIGADIDGETAGDLSGTSVCLSGDGTHVSIGATLNNGSGPQSGHVRVYENLAGTWTQVGADINGEIAYDWCGSGVGLSVDGTIVVIGAFKNDGGGSSSGHVRVFEYIGGIWTQLGGDIDGEALADEFGRVVSLNGDGTVFVAGAPKNDNGGADAGNARVFQYVGGVWAQIGASINGLVADECGWSVGISDQGTTIAVGSPKNDAAGAESGQVRTYENVSGTWVLKGTNIGGEALYDRWGWAVSLDEYGTHLAGGGYVNDGNGTSSGHARVYRFDCDSLDETISATELCFGDLLTLEAVSVIGSTVTWDMGVLNGVPFVPASTGVTTYTATTDSPNDCPFSIDITVYELPIVTAAVDPDEICLGESATFNGGGAVSYTWDGGVTDNVSFTPVSAGTVTYTVTGRDDNSCENTATVDLIVNPLPTVTATATPDVICLGESLILTGGGADSYVWDGGATDGVSFTPVAAGITTYTVTGTVTATGCENTATVNVTVNDTPAVVATATPDEICLGESVLFTGAGADTYVWDMGVLDGVPFTPIAAGAFTFTVTGTITATGCQGTHSTLITVFDAPIVTASVSPTEICLGESAIFSGGGAVSYSWDLGVTDGLAFTPVTTGTTTYTVTGTAGGCENTATVDLTVNALPVVVAFAGPMEICLGEDIVFTGGGADTYVWDGGVIDGAAFTPTTSGTTTYTVIGTDLTTGCENTASVDVTIYPNPIVTPSATQSEICLGESIILSGSGADSYDWDLGVTDGVAFAPTEAGSFTYTVTGYLGPLNCEDTKMITIIVYELPEVTATVDPGELCLGESAVFNGAGADSYVWDNDVIDDERYTPEEAGIVTYTVTGTSADGCEGFAAVDLIVYELPDLTAELDTIINTGGTADLIAYSSLAGTYYWSPYKEVECDTCSVTTASPINDTEFIVEFYDENGCSAMAEVMVYVNYIEGIGVPLAFSPNYDGTNDILYVKGYHLQEMTFEIYNKYGERVFSTLDQNIGWDGTFKNRDENPGVFAWVLQYTLEDGRSGLLKGDTTLLR